MSIRIGCAGWSIGRSAAEHFPVEGTHLGRFGAVFNCVEINSSFYRSHRPQTYARWALSTPSDFRFAVKISKVVTHELRLCSVEVELDRILAEVSQLGEKLGPLLFQLPPSLAFDARIAGACFSSLRDRFSGSAVCEPRHPTWFDDDAVELLKQFEISRAAVDPAIIPAAALPGASPRSPYYRLHGSPRMYYSSYDRDYLTELAEVLRTWDISGHEVWCIFDNTALGAAIDNALVLLDLSRNAAVPKMSVER
ncbi:MAG TPA: DUF72 domain-containing protein [Planctomycetaceae bacterium]|jgi:uncharacterized protein YecE (DUF72 family)